MATKNKKKESSNQTIEERLKNLYRLQLIDSEIDRIRITRGELPLEVRDLEDDIAGLETRIQKLENEVKDLNEQIVARKNGKKDAEALIKKYTEQQNNVRNNREYDSLSKEIEFQTLEIELCEKKIKEHVNDIEMKKSIIEEANSKYEDRLKDLEAKKGELENIIAETKKDEEKLDKKRKELSEIIEPRLGHAYNRIRNNVINKLAVVAIERDACGGCFNKIPPQRQLDIRSARKIIPCEYCGRILVSPNILEEKE